MNKPCVLIYTHLPDVASLKEIIAGLEEEGVPFEISESELNTLDASALAADAADICVFGCGLGICGANAAMAARGCGTLLETIEAHRKLGQNAARYVKKEAFI